MLQRQDVSIDVSLVSLSCDSSAVWYIFLASSRPGDFLADWAKARVFVLRRHRPLIAVVPCRVEVGSQEAVRNLVEVACREEDQAWEGTRQEVEAIVRRTFP